MWLVFTYGLPAAQSPERVKIWRRLSGIGAIQLKTSLYILPDSDENREHFQWLGSEVEAMKGQAVLLKTEKMENIKDEEIIRLFHNDRDSRGTRIANTLQAIQVACASRKKKNLPEWAKLKKALLHTEKETLALKSIDFFGFGTAEHLLEKIEKLKRYFTTEPTELKPGAIPLRAISDFQKRTWATRPRPFIDRVASFWLIKRFIDKEAQLRFISEAELPRATAKGWVSFDMKGAVFTHTGKSVTFEVLRESFRINDPLVQRIGQLVHQIDLKDEMFYSEEAKGVETILRGILQKYSQDEDAMAAGLLLFDTLGQGLAKT